MAVSTIPLTSAVSGTLPVANGGTGTTTAPAFSAYISGYQAGFSLSTYTKVNLNTEAFDTNSNFDTSNYRFTPTVAGYYQFNGYVSCGATSVNPTGGGAAIYKNGTGYVASVVQTATASNPGYFVGALIYMNGSTDYVELYGVVYGGSGPAFNGDASGTMLSGVLVRGA